MTRIVVKCSVRLGKRRAHRLEEAIHDVLAFIANRQESTIEATTKLYQLLVFPGFVPSGGHTIHIDTELLTTI